MKAKLPNLTDFDQKNIDDYPIQRKILSYFNLKGKTYTTVEQSMIWLLNYRLNSSVEFRAPWSDNFTKGETGELSLIEGCFSYLFLLSHLKEIELKTIFKNPLSFSNILFADFLLATTNQREIIAANDTIGKVLELSDQDYSIFNYIIKSPKPYIENVSAEMISIEVLSHLSRSIILFFEIEASDHHKIIFQIFKDNLPNYNKYLKKILNFCIYQLSDYGIIHDGFSAFLNSTQGWSEEIDLYHTLTGVKALSEYSEYYKNNSENEDLLKKVKDAIRDIKNNLLNNKSSKGKDVGWSILLKKKNVELSGTLLGINILETIYEIYERDGFIDEIDTKIIIEDLMQYTVFPKLKTILKTKYFATNKESNYTEEDWTEVNNIISGNILLHENFNVNYKIDNLILFYIEGLIKYIANFNYEVTSKGKKWQWDESWEILASLVSSVLNHFVPKDTLTGICLPRYSESKLKYLVSLKSTHHSLQVFNRFGISRNAKSGIVDIIKDTLADTTLLIVKNIFQKYSNLEKHGYRIAWGDIESDFNKLEHTESEEEYDSSIISKTNEIDLLIEIETLLPNLELNLSKRALTSWKAKIRTVLIDSGIDNSEVKKLLVLIEDKANEFNKNSINFINKLIRTKDSNTFRLICNENFIKYNLNNIITLYDKHILLFEKLRKIESGNDLSLSTIRLEILKEILTKIQ